MRHKRVEVIAVSAVGRIELVRDEVLAARRRLKRVGRLRCMLEALDKVHRVFTGLERVLSCGLDVAAPARVTHDVYHRRPKRRPRKTDVAEGAALTRDLVARLVPQRAVERA